MKKSLKTLMALVAVNVIVGCVSMVSAQRITGGYKTIPPETAEVQSAAEFAVADQGRQTDTTIKLISVEHAERQSAAGTNYRLCLKVETHDDAEDTDTTQVVKVVVRTNLKGENSLTSWEEENCAEHGSSHSP